MPMGPSYARDLARRAPPPDELDALGADDDDFAAAAGFKSTPKAYAAFKEAVRACMKR